MHIRCTKNAAFLASMTGYAYVVNFSHVDILRLNARTETVIGVTEMEEESGNWMKRMKLLKMDRNLETLRFRIRMVMIPS